MAVATDERASLAEIFDKHASLTIDALAYQTNPMLRECADRVMAAAGLTAKDVAREGVTIYRHHAVITAWENTSDGSPIFRDEARVRRIVTVDF